MNKQRASGPKDGYARIGNYIDFGAMQDVSTETFLRLFDDPKMGEADHRTYLSFLAADRPALSC